jgi:hypothetical protein
MIRSDTNIFELDGCDYGGLHSARSLDDRVGSFILGAMPLSERHTMDNGNTV